MSPQKSKQSLVSEWMNTYPSNNTERNYRTAMKQFFESVFGESSLDLLDKQAQEYFSQNRDHQREILKYVKKINHLAPLTVKPKISGVRTFFIEQGIARQPNVRRRLKGKAC